MNRLTLLQRILDLGLVAILRAPSGERLIPVCAAIMEGGIDVIEVTYTVPDASRVLAEARQKFGARIRLGAGTILDTETARAAIFAGAEFLVTPTVNPAVIELGHRYDVAVLCGAFSPTEVLTAWEAGADIVKLFPAEIGGPGLVKALRGPFPQIRLLPTGGVNLQTIEGFFKAGACAVGLGTALVDASSPTAFDPEQTRDRAATFVAAAHSARFPKIG